MLEKLELPFDIGIHAHEQQAGIPAFLGHISAADMQDAVTEDIQSENSASYSATARLAM